MTTILPGAHTPVAERSTRAFLDMLNASGGPPLETLPVADARAVLESAQSSIKPFLQECEIAENTIDTDVGPIRLVTVHPANAPEAPPCFMFFHGGGWVLGDFRTHERLIRDIVAYSGAAAVYVDYDRSPEATYPTALMQCAAATRWVAKHGRDIGVDGSRLAVVGNSVGGNLATAVALRLKVDAEPQLRCQVLLWPVTDSRLDTPSYEQFQNGHFLTRGMMKWFWDSYTPDVEDRTQIFVSPLRATLGELSHLPPTIIHTAELDVLRDEGEAYARNLNDAGVEVTCMRMVGMIHDYGLLNPLAQIPAVQASLRQIGSELRRRLA